MSEPNEESTKNAKINIEKVEKNNTNKFLACTSLAMVLVTTVMVGLTCQSNIRIGKLFVGQNKPLIDVSPIDIKQVNKKFTETRFSVVNYSGFVASNIRIDVKYDAGSDTNTWNAQSYKANIDKQKKGNKTGVVIGDCYSLKPDVNDLISQLKPGERGSVKSIGSLPLRQKIVTGYDHYYVYVRVTWENKKGHIFDEIHKHKLIWTKEGSGIALTMIPEGVVSQKDIPKSDKN